MSDIAPMRNALILTIATGLLVASGLFAYKGFRERTAAPASTTQTTSPAKANKEAISPEVRSLALAMLDRHDSDQDVLAYMRQMSPSQNTDGSDNRDSIRDIH